MEHGDRLHDLIPNDLLIRILFKLPAKSIMRFNSVCKAWRSLINRPSFIDQHTSKNSNLYVLINRLYEINETTYQFATRILSYNTLGAVSTQSFSSASPYPRRDDNLEFTNFFIKGCCNGLVLVVDCDDVVVDYDYDFDFDEDEDYDNDKVGDVNYALWNLAMGETKVLPTCLSRSQPNYRSNALFEIVGFGFDAESRDYKVVKMHKLMKDINSTRPSAHIVVEVYSLRTNSWKTVTTDLPHSTAITDLNENNGVFCNGMYSWTANVGTGFGLRGEIVSFDMSEEVITRTHMPNDICVSTSPTPTPSSNINCLLVFKESLAVVNCDRQNGQNFTAYDIWVLGQYGVKESWSKRFRFANFCGFASIERFMGFWKVEKVLVQSSYGEELLLYDPVAPKLTGLEIFGQQMKLFYYRESLVPINSKSTHLNIEEEK